MLPNSTRAPSKLLLLHFKIHQLFITWILSLYFSEVPKTQNVSHFNVKCQRILRMELLKSCVILMTTSRCNVKCLFETNKYWQVDMTKLVVNTLAFWPRKSQVSAWSVAQNTSLEIYIFKCRFFISLRSIWVTGSSALWWPFRMRWTCVNLPGGQYGNGTQLERFPCRTYHKWRCILLDRI